MITRADILQDIYDAVGETQGNSSWDSSYVVRAVNRESRRLSATMPLRLAQLRITGDGVATVFELAEPVERVVVVTENNAITPQIGMADAIATVFGRTLLASDLYVNFGWSFEPPNRLRINPVLNNGEQRQVYAMAGCGQLRDSSYTTGSVSATNDSLTVTGSGTSWSSNASAGDTIAIAGAGYVIASVDSDTQITLTEPYRGATATGLSYEIGGHLLAPRQAQALLAYSTAERIATDLGDLETATANAGRARVERRRYRGAMERLTTAQRGG